MTDAEKLAAIVKAAEPVIERLHQLLGAGTLEDDVIQNTLGAWMQAMELVE